MSFEPLKWEVLKWARVGSRIIIEIPEESPLIYKGVTITKGDLGYGFTYNYIPYQYPTLEECYARIDVLTAPVIPPVEPPPVIPPVEPPPVIPPVEPPPVMSTWKHECDSFTGVSSYNGNLPQLGNSTWKFIIPARLRAYMDVITDKADFGYGTYEVRFKANGHLMEIYCPLYLTRNLPGPPYDELDLSECYAGSNPRQTEITSWHGPDKPNVKSSSTGPYNTSMPFEDGQFHTFKFIWTPLKVEHYMDEILQKTFNIAPGSEALSGYLRLVCNITNPSGLNETDFVMEIDSIKYTKLPEAL